MNTLNFEACLAKQYKYKKLPKKYSEELKDYFYNNLPVIFQQHLNGSDNLLYSMNGTLISKGFTRVVIGDYGAFIEYSEQQACTDNYIIKPGQEYRIYDPKYSNNVKYHWYTTKDNSNIKIYYQLKTVSYADYRPNMYYVSPHELKI